MDIQEIILLNNKNMANLARAIYTKFSFRHSDNKEGSAMIKRAVIFFIGFGSAVTVGNLARADQLQSFMGCIEITADAKRLACFDAASKKMIDSGTGVLAVEKARPTKEEQISDFGKKQLRKSPIQKIREKQKKEDDKALKKIKLTVVEVAYTTSKKFVLFMENGQVWKQKEGIRIRLPKGKFEVEIKKGMVSGYNMIVPTRRSLIRVKRLK